MFKQQYSQQPEHACKAGVHQQRTEGVVCVYNGILLSHEKEWNLATGSNIETQRALYLVKQVRERGQTLYDITYV